MAPRTFVDLLYADAPPEAYEQVVVDAAGSGADGTELTRLRAELDTALRVREQRQRLRRREAELSALYATAQDLTAIRDVDAVLQAIAGRARQLLAADITYLSLNDAERGDSYIMVTDGSVSDSFRGLRLPLGTGLLGLVAQTGAPYSTDDYATDSRFLHRGFVDRAVDDEGIRAILGVPLEVDGAVIGTLCAAHRSPRPFPADEVALLRSFAAHAAIALENARLFERARSVGEQMRAHSESVEQAALAHDRLTEVLLTAGDTADASAGLGGVAQVVADVLGGTVWVLDADGRALTCSDPAAPAPPVEGADEQVWLAPARAGAEHLTTLALRGPTAVGPADRRTLERAALVAALVVLFSRSVSEADDRVRGEVLDDLLADPVRQLGTVRERALRHGADLDAPHVVLVVRVLDAERLRTAAAATRVAAESGGLAGRHDGDSVLVLPGTDALERGRRVHERLADGSGPVTVGVAGPVSGVRAFGEAWREARQCAVTLLALGRDGEVADQAALGLTRLLLGSTGPQELHGFLARTLGPVQDYDERRGTELVATLEAWYACAGSAAETGRRLHVHPNTVAQRLERVGRLLGPGWRDADRALETQLALRLLRLQASES